MKKLLLSLIFSASFACMQAQDYKPFLEEGKVWYETKYGSDWEQYNKYTLGGDTVICDMVYKKLHYGKSTYHLREQGQRVYFYDTNEQAEELLYDFSLKVGDEVQAYPFKKFKNDKFYASLDIDLTMRLDSIKPFNDNGTDLRMFYFSYVNSPIDINMEQICWLEGVGCMNYSNELAFFFEGPYYWVAGDVARFTGCSVNGETFYGKSHTCGLYDQSLDKFFPAEDPDDETGIVARQSQRPDQRQLHDLQGRRLTEAPERGMYIQDGKVMMK